MTVKRRLLHLNFGLSIRSWSAIAVMVTLIHLMLLLGVDRVLLGLLLEGDRTEPQSFAVQMMAPSLPAFSASPLSAPPPPAAGLMPPSEEIAATALPEAPAPASDAAAAMGPPPTPAADISSRTPQVDELPRMGGVAMSVFWGDFTAGSQIGKGSIQMGFLPESRYQIKLVTQAMGWAKLFSSNPLYAETIGTIGPGGFRPERYTHVSPRGKEEVSVFDYTNKKITYSSLKEPLPLPNGVQDRLSFIVQLAWMLKVDPERFGLGESVTIPMAGRIKVEDVTFLVQSDADLVMPGGVLVPALHLSSHREGDRFSGQIDVWLDRTDRLLPVRIRFEENRGQILDLLTVRQ